MVRLRVFFSVSGQLIRRPVICKGPGLSTRSIDLPASSPRNVTRVWPPPSTKNWLLDMGTTVDLAVSGDRRNGVREGAGIDLRLLPRCDPRQPR
jgi:hypothetical protein